MPEPISASRRREYALYRRTFPRQANARRLELIEKQFGGFSAEEGTRRLDLDPVWKAEFERRIIANLTDAERAELEQLTAVVNEWNAKAPWTVDQSERSRRADDDLRRLFDSNPERSEDHAEAAQTEPESR